MVLKTYFFDTYALIEVIKGSKNYREFSTFTSMVITKLQLMELYYSVLCESGKERADFYYDFFSPSSIVIKDETIKNAMLFRSQHKKRRLSYVDCLGYIFALEKGIPFLTGDKEFEQFPNVCFVK
ncbi:PIN domain-containing protein [Candidatus Woesearchaeota archaeon]|nr:PIN domain-containing protein [Candidatus Woesearchaeota archaeon]